MKRKYGTLGYTSSAGAMSAFKAPRTRRYHATRRAVAIPRSVSNPIGGYRSVPASFRSKKGEVKAIDIPVANYVFSLDAGSTNVFPLNLVQEGTGFYNRIGRKIEMLSLHMRGSILQTGNAAAADDFVKWAIVYDRQPTGALPNYNNIFLDYNPSGATSNGPYSNINLDNRDRYQIIRHDTFACPATAITDLASVSQVITIPPKEMMLEEFIKLRGLTTHFNGTASPLLISNITTGALYLVTQGRFTLGNEGYQLSVQFRLRYDDL